MKRDMLAGYNRNLVGGKRKKRKIQKFGKCKTLSERLSAESKALTQYLTRVNQI